MNYNFMNKMSIDLNMSAVSNVIKGFEKTHKLHTEHTC